MRTIPRLLGLAALLAVLPACIIHDDGGPITYPPDGRTQLAVRFDVLLDGYACEDVPEVTTIHVTIDDPSGPVNLDVPCPRTGEQIYVPGFWPGTYPWRLAALDANGYLLYDAQGTVSVVDVSPLVSANLIPADTGLGVLTFFWSFGPGAQRCRDVGVRDVDVTIGDATFTMPCAPESAAEGAAFDVPAGMYTWSIVARGDEPGVQYEATGSFVIRADEALDVDVALQAVIIPDDPGELEITWTFAGSSNCATYEIENVYVQVWAGTTPLLGEDDLGVRLPCAQHGVVVSPLSAGPYEIDLHGESRVAGRYEITFRAFGVSAHVEKGMTTEIGVDLGPL